MAISPYPGQTSLSTPKRGYPSQLKLIHAKTTLSTEKSGCLAQMGLFETKWARFGVNKLVLQPMGLSEIPYSFITAGGTTSTLHGASRVTSVATLPITKRSKPPVP
jgi:hypothetical protein